MWQLTMYCNWRPPDMPLLTQNGFWGPGMSTTSFRWFHLHSLCGATLFGSHQRHLLPFVWHSLVEFRLLTSVCNAWQRSRIQNLQRVLENLSPISARLWTKVHEILERCSRPSYFLTPLSDYLCHVSFRKQSPLSLEVVEKPSKCKRLLAPNFCRRDASDFRTAVRWGDLLPITWQSLVEFRFLISVCEAMAMNAEFTEGG